MDVPRYLLSFELAECPLCGDRRQEQAYVARDRHYGISGTYRIVRCLGCSLLFLNPMYSERELSQLYPDTYYAYQNNFRRSRWKAVLRKLLRYEIRTKDPSFAKPGRMLDLGCGSGWFLAEMRERNWETQGVEISKAAAEIGRKNAGLNIFNGTLEQAAFPSESFDYIRSNHSFEHIATPNETLDELYRILKRDGKLLIGVPNEASLTSRMFGQYWWYRGAPVHPFTYSAATLSALLKKHQFRIERVVFNSDASGILGSVQIWLNRKTQPGSSSGWLFRNHILQILCQWAAKVTDLLELGDEIEITAAKS